MSLRIFLIVTVLCLVAASRQAGAEERLALLVGNSRYDYATPLRNPENDVAVVARSLEQAGFRTTVVTNVALDPMNEAVDAFVAQAKSYDRPTVLVYFAGHGIQRDGKNFLLPVNLELTDPSVLETDALEVDPLLARISASGASLSVVILDACRSDPFEKLERGATPLARGLSSVRQATSQLIAFSTAPGKTATDGDTGTSPYASAFAESVIMPGLTIRQVFDRVREKVSERTRGAQEPWESSAIHNDFYFVAPDPSSSVSEVEQLYWDNTAMIDTAEKYQSYLAKYPGGRFDGLARQKIENINKDFSFRKQAETFPVLASSGEGLNFCRNYDDMSNGLWSIQRFDDYRDQVVFIDFRMPLKGIICPELEGSMETAVVAGADGDCSTVLSISGIDDESRLPKPRCISSRTGDQMEHGSENPPDVVVRSGSLMVNDFEAGAFIVSAGEHPNYNFSYHPEEGVFNQAFITVTGLARVRMGPDGEGLYRELEPVDAAEIGMTWKYQNTLDAYQKGVEKSGVKSVSLDFDQAAYEREAAEYRQQDIPITSYWLHNGSAMALAKKEQTRQIIYMEPRPALRSAGIDTGTVLFEGTSADGKRYDGTSTTFSGRCDSVEYPVSGSVSDDDRTITLRGKAPIFDGKCHQKGARQEVMVFEFIGSAASINLDELGGYVDGLSNQAMEVEPEE